MDSIRPAGAWPDGTAFGPSRPGPVRPGLAAVEVIEGAWYRRCRKGWLHGVRLPLVLFPQSAAYRCVEDGRYRFRMTFTMPLLGSVLACGGCRKASPRALRDSF